MPLLSTVSLESCIKNLINLRLKDFIFRIFKEDFSDSDLPSYHHRASLFRSLCMRPRPFTDTLNHQVPDNPAKRIVFQTAILDLFSVKKGPA